MNQERLIVAGVGTVVLSVLNLIAYAPMLGALLFRKIDYFHRRVSSDIPGLVFLFDLLLYHCY
jgi:hypothetical protein